MILVHDTTQLLTFKTQNFDESPVKGILVILFTVYYLFFYRTIDYSKKMFSCQGPKKGIPKDISHASPSKNV